MLTPGDTAPGFSLPGIDASGAERVFSLGDYRSRSVILYFYPGDFTPGCTREASDFSALPESFKETMVIGISPDSVGSHSKFREKHHLRFMLLSDARHKVSALYGAWGEKTADGKTTTGIIRSTFLIDGSGRIKKAWYNVKVAGHVDEVLKTLQTI